MRRRSVFLASLLAAGVLGAGATFVAATSGAKAASTAAATVSALPGSWGSALQVPGTSGNPNADVSAVSCAPGGACTAVGWGLNNAPFVMTEAHGSWSKPAPLPGLSALGANTFPELTAIACPAAGECLATGIYGATKTNGFTIREAKGAWGKAAAVTGLSALATAGMASATVVSCASPGNCAVGGDYATGTSASPVTNGWVANLFGGAWKKVTKVGGVTAANLAVTAVSCFGPSNCAAAGIYQPATPAPVTASFKGSPALRSALAARLAAANATLRGLRTGAAMRAHGLLRSSASAPAVAAAAPLPFAVAEVDGTWNSAKLVVPTLTSASLGLVTALSCPVKYHCYVAGIAVDNASSATTWGYSFLVSQNGTGWNPPAKFPAIGIFSFACPANLTGNCTAGGADTSGVAAVMRDANGTWGPVTELPNATKLSYASQPAVGSEVDSLTCLSAPNCTAGGSFGVGPADNPTAQQVFVAGETNGAWAAAHVPSGIATLNAGGLASFNGLSCSSASSCALVGDFTKTSNSQGAFTLAEIPLQPTATTLAYMPVSVRFGSETAEHLSVTVTAQAGTAPGKVTVASGTKVVCTIALTAGKGSCTLTAKQLPVGTYHLVATYPGAFGFAKSVSGSKKLVVTS